MTNYPNTRGRGRGGGHDAQDGHSGRGRGQGYQGGNRGAGRGVFRGSGPGRGAYSGRGRGNRITDEQKAQIVGNLRPATIQIASEGTDDIIVVSDAAMELQHMANFILRKNDYVLRGQRSVRSFVYSCLVNLSNHHNIDTSGILTDLASPRGLMLLKDMLLMRMAIDAGDERDVLSFQFVVLPLIGILTREAVCQSTMTSETGIIYSTVYLHRRQFLEERVMVCMSQLLARGSLQDHSFGAQNLLKHDKSICQVSSLQCALLAIARLIYQLIKRTQDARIEMANMVKKLQEMQEQCLRVTADSPESRFINEVLVREVVRLQQIVSDAQGTLIEPNDPLAYLNISRSTTARGPNMVHLALAYDPPGQHSKDGPRHDNDKPEISAIALLPTQQEIACSRRPFLPSNGISEAPHFLPQGWRRQLDIHFRLYREDMMDPLRKGVMAFLNVLERTDKGKEDKLLKQNELRKHLDDNVSLNVYGDVQFIGMDCSKQLSGSVEIAFAQPPQVAGQPQKRRFEFWERSRRRLMQGALVCIASRTDGHQIATRSATQTFQMVLGVITRRDNEVLANDEKFGRVHISLTDPKQYIMMLNSEKKFKKTPWFLIESMGGFYESYRPILKAIQKCEPAVMPFGKYIAPTKAEEDAMGADRGSVVDPPLYARAPGFSFDLSVLLEGQPARLRVDDPYSVRVAENTLHAHREVDKKALDETQARALVETLCREVALISGPPGTGKTKIGVDLMRVLLHNKEAMNCGPILCICYTNHALDQFLEHLLNEKITDIVRVGARSKSERLEDYNLESLMKSRDRPFSVRQSLRAAHENWEKSSEKIKKVENALRSGRLEWEYLKPHLMMYYPYLHDQLEPSMSWILNDGSQDDSSDGDFTVVEGKTGGGIFARWSSGEDIKDKEKHNAELQKDAKKEGSEVKATYNPFGPLGDSFTGRAQGPKLLPIPMQNRPLRQLLTEDVWRMSLEERNRLVEEWKPEIQEMMMTEMGKLLGQIESINQQKNNAFDDIRRGILREASVIGMTTNGAAKCQTLVGAVAPKIIICEEAGEVLESHILATLSASTQHLILIGDHLQLRPSIETYNLSSDSKIGQSYNLDQSLFERLVTAVKNPLPLSKLTIQRRMRPEISSLIRNTLYEDLEDGETVLTYPPVSGMGANLFFMDHAHPEDSKDQYGMQSFANSFEVKMIEALAHYLIKNGYDQPGDIAVLTPYLGQLSKLRDCLRNSFMLVIDERDQEQLDLKDEGKEEKDIAKSNVNELIGVKKIGLQNHVTLRTIDNYQGEEAKIVIISLVRSNAKDNGSLTGSNSIGFLKSTNRTNVLLSRAQHGMFILGNAGLMENSSKNGLWPQIVQELREFDRVGEGFPIVCKHHPYFTNIVDEPDVFKIVAPNGGCTAQCGCNMPCGHICPLHCHPDDTEHLLVKCLEPCPRLHTQCDHVCPKRCGEKCGDCMEFVPSIVLACGHVFDKPRCWQALNPSKVVCRVKVTRQMPSCEHDIIMDCFRSVDSVQCDKSCQCALECGHKCTRRCAECQKTSSSGKAKTDTKQVKNMPVQKIERTVHGKCLTKCERNQFCGHACAEPCHSGVPCPPCAQNCEVTCEHFKCKQKCDEPCAACCQRCVWECPHQGQCNMPCGAPCDRLPCNKRCDKNLSCGHRCPSICGEKCPPEKFCTECKDPKIMGMMVDLIMNETLGEVEVNDDPILVLSCGHALTMSSLDGMMEMTKYYEEQTDKKTGEVTYIRTKCLPGDEVSQVPCHLCRKPINGLYRYGRRVKDAQLTQRSKKHIMQQAKLMNTAHQAFDVARARIEQNQANFLKSLERPATEPCADPPVASSRPLGKRLDPKAPLPNSNFDVIKEAFRIPKEHVEQWGKHIKPAMEAMQSFKAINRKASKSPTKLLFDAAVSHLYRIKTAEVYDPETNSIIQPDLPAGAQTASDVVQACIIECGLPRDGLSGSSFIDSLQERTNVLIVVLSQAQAAMEKVGVSSGWYWFVEDVLRCASLSAENLKNTALSGKFDRKVAFARLIQMDLICKTTQWIGRKALPSEENDPVARIERLKRVDELTAEFMREHKAITEIDTTLGGLRNECIPAAEETEKKMTRAVKIARGDSEYAPVSDEEKLMLFRAIQEEVRGSGHWYRCPNGHPYVIGECGMAMEQSRCPECGASIGGGHHALLRSNARDSEFESMHLRAR